MKISMKSIYGVTAITDLAIYEKNGPVTVLQISERQGIPSSYLEQIFSALKTAGIVDGIKGNQGGYLLAEEPKDIKAGRILRILDGTLSLLNENRNQSSNQTKIGKCLKENVWSKLDKALYDYLYSLSVKDLVDAYIEGGGQGETMYYI